MINELKNQHVHAWWGFWASFIALHFLHYPAFVMTGFFIGVCVELWQFFGKKEDLNLLDRLLDLSFWALGASLSKLVVWKF